MRVYSQLNWSSCHMSCMNVACNWSTCYSLRFRVSIQSHHVGLVCLLFFLFWYISRALQFSIAIISPSWLMRSHWICWLGKGYHRNLGKKVWLSLPDPAKKKVHLPRELLQWFEQYCDWKTTSNTADWSCEFDLIQILNFFCSSGKLMYFICI